MKKRLMSLFFYISVCQFFFFAFDRLADKLEFFSWLREGLLYIVKEEGTRFIRDRKLKEAFPTNCHLRHLISFPYPKRSKIECTKNAKWRFLGKSSVFKLYGFLFTRLTAVTSLWRPHLQSIEWKEAHDCLWTCGKKVSRHYLTDEQKKFCFVSNWNTPFVDL